MTPQENVGTTTGAAAPSAAGSGSGVGAGLGSIDGPGENGQTGSPGANACTTDEQCEVDPRAWTQRLGSVELAGARCALLEPLLDLLPVCHCTLHVTPAEPSADGGAAEPMEEGMEGGFSWFTEPTNYVEYAGHRGSPFSSGCSVFGRTPECTYCSTEFPGCHLGDDAACQAPCEELARRKNAELGASYDFSQRFARCVDGAYCDVVVELDGQCYARAPGPSTPPIDCSLPDSEIVERRNDFGGDECPQRPATRCDTAEDCPAGLACNGGTCGRCSDICSYEIGKPEEAVCEGDTACAAGELCTMGVCVLEENVECRFREQCGENGSCALSGIDYVDGRGNERTRSFCVAGPDCPPEMRDESGNLMMPSEMVPGCH